MSRLVKILRTGRLEYSKGLKLQNTLAGYGKTNSPQKFHNTLILTEHDPVYTIGIRTNKYTIDDEQRLRSLGAQYFKTNRGGLITFHGPGQLVVYPILNLRDFQPSIRCYVQNIEKTIIELCKSYEIEAKTSPDTGVWIEDRKICAIGIHASHYITSHGLALNCNTDLNWFNNIVPCGIEGKGVTSLSKELSRNITIDEVIPKFLDNFKNVFKCDLQESSDNNLNDIFR